jgi:uncharacterized protein involved in exopolysaccharide biosynthesis/Mrp family chromosome partitioning ATPase
MAYRLAIDPLPTNPLLPSAALGSRALVPIAPSSLGLPSPLSQVDHSPYLSTPAPQFNESIISIADLFSYLKKHWLKGLYAGVPTAALIFYALGMGAKVYEAEAKLRLRLQDSSVASFGDSRPGFSELSAPQLINNHLTEMMSHRFADFFYEHFDPVKRAKFAADVSSRLGRKDQLLKAIGLYKPGKPVPEREIFVEALAGAARVEPQKESHILRLLVRDLDPKMAADIANGMSEQYMRFYGESESHLTESDRNYLKEQAEMLKKRLEKSERELSAYSKSQDIFQPGEIKDVDGERVRQFNAALTEAQLKLARAKNELQSIRTTQQAGRDLREVRSIADHPDVAFNRKELEAKILTRRALESQCGRRHPNMIALASEIESLKNALDTSVNSVVTMAETEVTNLERQIADYEKQLSTVRGEAIDQSGKTVQQRLLSDQVNTDRETYQSIVKKLSQAEISGQFKDAGALSLSDVATAPETPVKPNKPIAAVASFMIFGILLIGLPVGWGLFDDHVMKLIRQGGSPSANIPSVKHVSHVPVGQSPSTPVQHTLSQPIVAPMITQMRPSYPPVTIPGMPQTPVLAKLPLIGSAHPEAMLSQLLKPEPMGAAGALHQITTTLEMQALKRSGLGGIILITSADAGEGKTVSAAALAAAFCHQGRSVFMMECNAVSPTLHQWFPQAYNHSSWANDLESLRYGNTHLFLLPAHDLPAYATNELLDGYRAWIDRARQHVDWIILDSGPVLRNFADVAPLAPLATDVILVNNPAISNPTKLRATLNLLQPMMSSSAFRGLIVHGG